MALREDQTKKTCDEESISKAIVKTNENLEQLYLQMVVDQSTQSKQQLTAPSAQIIKTTPKLDEKRQQQMKTSQITQEQRIYNRQAREHRGLAIVFGIVTTYFICWTGFFIWYIAQGICPKSVCPPVPVGFQVFLIWLGYAQSGINPLIYFFTNRDFRNAFNSMVNNCMGRPNPRRRK